MYEGGIRPVHIRAVYDVSIPNNDTYEIDHNMQDGVIIRPDTDCFVGTEIDGVHHHTFPLLAGEIFQFAIQGQIEIYNNSGGAITVHIIELESR